MQDKKLEWADIGYFSKGLILGSDTGQLTLSVNSPMTVSEFTAALLEAGAKAETTLNATIPIEGRASNFSSRIETPPVYDEVQKQYSKSVTYTFTHSFIVPAEEVEA